MAGEKMKLMRLFKPHEENRQADKGIGEMVIREW